MRIFSTFSLTYYSMNSKTTPLTGSKGPPEDTIQNQIRKNKTMDKKELNEILKLHKMWMNGEEGGVKANLWLNDLRGMDLSGMDLREVNLLQAFLNHANLRGANLSGVNLCDASLYGADLTGANLEGACLYRTDLTNANLSNANLRDANLTEADLTDAVTDGADFTNASLFGAIH